MEQKIAIIAGAGPAGLTAAYELLKRTDIKPLVFEKSGDIGGISKTVNYKGNRIDIGGHRFFSKSDRVMQWWLDILPIDPNADEVFDIHYQNKSKTVSGGKKNTDDPDKIMLVRNRLSRIYFLKKFFSYPISLSVQTIKGLGLWRTFKIFISYLKARAFPIKNEQSLEQFFINRFGKELYLTFFKDYTEKVWGQKCNEISADWGAQRIKGLSITKALAHAVKQLSKKSNKNGGIGQKETETSLIERFLYPKYGPGQMWETVANLVQEQGGVITMNSEVTKINLKEGKVHSVIIKHQQSGQEEEIACDYFFSTMPVRQLIGHIHPAPPQPIRDIAAGLLYRDFITVGLLMKKLKTKRNEHQAESADNLIQDNWIYIQERDVQVGRLQIFNNWSPFMVADPEKVWIGMEYFCNEGDELWTQTDEQLKELGIAELSHIGIIRKEDVEDATVLRMEKAYPAYFGTYDEFSKVRDYTDTIPNMYLIGRNGMHKYNNSDHSMLTAMTAVDNIVAGRKDKQNIWKINTEMEYHEEK